MNAFVPSGKLCDCILVGNAPDLIYVRNIGQLFIFGANS